MITIIFMSNKKTGHDTQINFTRLGWFGSVKRKLYWKCGTAAVNSRAETPRTFEDFEG